MERRLGDNPPLTMWAVVETAGGDLLGIDDYRKKRMIKVLSESDAPF